LHVTTHATLDSPFFKRFEDGKTQRMFVSLRDIERHNVAMHTPPEMRINKVLKFGQVGAFVGAKSKLSVIQQSLRIQKGYESAVYHLLKHLSNTI
jgi:hypothetical protein